MKKGFTVTHPGSPALKHKFENIDFKYDASDESYERGFLFMRKFMAEVETATKGQLLPEVEQHIQAHRKYLKRNLSDAEYGSIRNRLVNLRQEVDSKMQDLKKEHNISSYSPDLLTLLDRGNDVILNMATLKRSEYALDCLSSALSFCCRSRDRNGGWSTLMSLSSCEVLTYDTIEKLFLGL